MNDVRDGRVTLAVQGQETQHVDVYVLTILAKKKRKRRILIPGYNKYTVEESQLSELVIRTNQLFEHQKSNSSTCQLGRREVRKKQGGRPKPTH